MGALLRRIRHKEESTDTPNRLENIRSDAHAFGTIRLTREFDTVKERRGERVETVHGKRKVRFAGGRARLRPRHRAPSAAVLGCYWDESIRTYWPSEGWGLPRVVINRWETDR
jgi:hypothetical protein